VVNASYLPHSGDLCRVTGDCVLVEFASAVDAVTFAVGAPTGPSLLATPPV
jgi:hypothetical protein